ncbi:galactose mutarotase-like [Neodiprion virginianus]|uniref:galactose mutarotase-like n=1 Tax=Neodiprion virginianus TaxID=2961670 RepID=UPI001EE698F9|nr:galactose mutarotase-like [Neodiprion virginianus]
MAKETIKKTNVEWSTNISCFLFSILTFFIRNTWNGLLYQILVFARILCQNIVFKMTTTCNCRDAQIVEGIFGEIYPGSFQSASGDAEYGSISKDVGSLAPVKIKSYTLTNNNRMQVVLITWGATIVSLTCPDKFGSSADVVMGFDDLDSYMDPNLNLFFGSVLGRCANRIKDGMFSIKDRDFQLSKNDNNVHHLHGGLNGFGRQVWDGHIDGCTVVMTYLSKDGEEGYPGDVLATVRFKLTPDNRLEISMRAITSKSTIVNMSHGSYFNLAGHAAGVKELNKHRISLNCDRWTFADYTDPVPTGAIRGVGGTVMDLRIPQILGDCLSKVPPGDGYDHNFCVLRSWQPGTLFVARALHPPSGRILEVYSDQPGVQFYTGGRLPPQTPSDIQLSYDICPQKQEQIEKSVEAEQLEDCYDEIIGEGDEGGDEETFKDYESQPPPILEFIPGKKHAEYRKHGAFCIQPQNYPNAINHKHFPCSILRPGQVYYHDLIYKFGVQLGNYM